MKTSLSSSRRLADTITHHTSFMAHLICLNIVSTHVFFFLFFKRSSGSSAETSIRGPECHFAAILLGINTELHHSLGENLSNREIHSGVKVCTMVGKCPRHSLYTLLLMLRHWAALRTQRKELSYSATIGV